MALEEVVLGRDLGGLSGDVPHWHTRHHMEERDCTGCQLDCPVPLTGRERSVPYELQEPHYSWNRRREGSHGRHHEVAKFDKFQEGPAITFGSLWNNTSNPIQKGFTGIFL